MQDYGGPVGFRMALVHPERIEGAYRSGCCGAQRRPGVELEDAASLLADRAATRARCAQISLARDHAYAHVETIERGRYDPDLWTDEFYFLNQPGKRRFKAICLRLSNQCGGLPEMASMDAREAAAPARDLGSMTSRSTGEPERYRKDVRTLTSVLDAGHFHWTRLQMRSPH